MSKQDIYFKILTLKDFNSVPGKTKWKPEQSQEQWAGEEGEMLEYIYLW